MHESAPVRFWDHDLGPDQPRLFAVDPDQVQETEIGWAGGDKEARVADGTEVNQGLQDAERAATYARLRDLTPEPGRALDGEAFELTPDGTSVVTGWWQWDPAGESHCELVMIDVASGKRRVLLSGPEFDFSRARGSRPDGRFIVCLREKHATAERPIDVTLVMLDAGGSDAGGSDTGGSDTGGSDTGGEPGRDLLPGYDRWPGDVAWSHDSGALYFAADDGGRRPVFRLDIETGEVTRVTDDDGAYTDLNPGPDGRYLYALRATVDSPPTPVRIDLVLGAESAALDCPGLPVTVPGRLEEVLATADDGHPLRSWLVLPETASADRQAPLLLWVHGGPMGSWNSWSWRWNPWLMAARGYAVLLPDPALSTGYGLEFIARAHRDWGARPFADIMAATEAAVARPDIDADRVGMMGGSYGGYMANWMAGHTDRFKAIVSHAGLWVLDQMFGTTDHPDVLAAAVRGPADQPGDVRGELAAPAHRPDPHADAGHPRQQGLPGTGRRGDCGCGGTCPGTEPRPSSCTSPTRTTGSSPRATRGSGTRPSSPSSPSTSWTSPGSVPGCSEPRGCQEVTPAASTAHRVGEWRVPTLTSNPVTSRRCSTPSRGATTC